MSTCFICKKQHVKLLTCGECLQFEYCSDECGKTHICMYDVFSTEPVFDRGHEPPSDIHPSRSPMKHGLARVYTGHTGDILLRKSKFVFDYDSGTHTSDGSYDIAYTTCVPEVEYNVDAPYIVFLHGVPTNRRQWWPIQKRVARYMPTISFDMLGMGQSDHPRNYGAWEWKYDVLYIKQLFDQLVPPGKNIIFVADDWGGGILATYIGQITPDPRIVGAIFLDPIAFDGYPVSEIQAIGRSSAIQDDATFQMVMGAFDQTLVQIYKVNCYLFFSFSNLYVDYGS